MEEDTTGPVRKKRQVRTEQHGGQEAKKAREMNPIK